MEPTSPKIKGTTMQVNSIINLNFNRNSILKSNKQSIDNFNKEINTNTNNNFYPKNYYLNQITFGTQNRFSANNLIKIIGKKNFPSPEIVKKLRAIGNSKDYCLYDIHLEHYKDLLNCSTLDEAKIKYPEFKDVTDAKDFNYQAKSKTSLIYKIYNKEIPNIDINNLSLELLKKQYGQFLHPTNKNAYFGISYHTICVLFDLLNIKKINKSYIFYTLQSREEYKNSHFTHAKQLWTSKKGEELREKFKTPEFREKLSKAKVLSWETISKESKKRMSQNSKRPEVRQKISDSTKKRWTEHGDKYREILRSPEVRKKMSNSAKNRWAKKREQDNIE